MLMCECCSQSFYRLLCRDSMDCPVGVTYHYVLSMQSLLLEHASLGKVKTIVQFLSKLLNIII